MLLTYVLVLMLGRGVLARVYIEDTTDDTKRVSSSSEKVDPLDPDIDPACSISLQRDLSIMQPLLLEPGSERFVWPRLNGTTVELDAGQELELFCSHGFRKGSPGGQSKTAIISCAGDDGFTFEAERYNISQFACQRPVFHAAERTGGKCFANGTTVRIGFELPGGRFAQLYEVCFDEETLRTHYVKHRLTPHNGHHQRAVKRPGFLQGNFYDDLKMGSVYSFATQRATIERILGSAGRADAVLDSKRGLFFARGHLAAKSDFIYGAHQRASFWLLNVAPQWQRFNGFNWQRIETSVKAHVAERGLWLTVYTGTYGVLELPDANGDGQAVYLDFDPERDPAGRVPVPKLFYKVLIDERARAGIALIGINNPHATEDEIAEQYVVCRDVSERIAWLRWKRHSIPDGYAYACDVNEFNDVTGHLRLAEPIRKLLV
ncbi:uncharacterized protein LOC128275393 [Anopheles cruzii]|uniref:uncharacterized protein LOC128275393 n=1 Tax=Anopheles cruzii TaxID=68878 RepID=UPI0022EC8408|nr:uncharacterized protein LOC128275393 [Anopheles cruzii]